MTVYRVQLLLFCPSPGPDPCLGIGGDGVLPGDDAGRGAGIHQGHDTYHHFIIQLINEHIAIIFLSYTLHYDKKIIVQLPSC